MKQEYISRTVKLANKIKVSNNKDVYNEFFTDIAKKIIDKVGEQGVLSPRDYIEKHRNHIYQEIQKHSEVFESMTLSKVIDILFDRKD